MRMPSVSRISRAEVRVIMLSAAFAMFVCGWPGPLYARANWPSMALTLTTYFRRDADAAIAGRSRLTSRNGAVTLASWTSSISRGSTSCTTWVQLFASCRSGTRPPASIAVPAARRASDDEPAVMASSVTSAAVIPVAVERMGCAATDAARAAGCASAVWPNVSSSGRSPSGRGAASASDSGAYEPGERRTVCAALLMRMSSGPAAATASVRPITCAGSRRSRPTMRRRCTHSCASGRPAKRRTASRGKRVVIVVWAPSRRRRSAMCMPILARPPVRSARMPERSVRASRFAWLRSAQSGQSWW